MFRRYSMPVSCDLPRSRICAVSFVFSARALVSLLSYNRESKPCPTTIVFLGMPEFFARGEMSLLNAYHPCRHMPLYAVTCMRRSTFYSLRTGSKLAAMATGFIAQSETKDKPPVLLIDGRIAHSAVHWMFLCVHGCS